MKKIHSIILTLIASVTFYSCDLDVPVNDRYDNDETWSNPALINGIMVGLYDNLELEPLWHYYDPIDFGVDVTGKLPCHYADEASTAWHADYFSSPTLETCRYGDEWGGYKFFAPTYKSIRGCNVALKNVQETKVLDEKTQQMYEAEIRFIRAFHYFNLVKRFGGVPLITEVQEYTGPGDIGKLQAKRDKEQVIWDFVLSEMEFAIKALPETRSDAERARVNKYAALALRSRAALYAASIAQYGTVQLGGLVGIEGSAEKYWRIAFNAADSIIKYSSYELYNRDGDKSVNFHNLFLEKTNFGPGGNNEYIFWKEYSPGQDRKGHAFDLLYIPYGSMTVGYGSGYVPTLNLVEAFEYVDGSEGALKYKDASGNYIRYQSLGDIFENKDPRLKGSFYLPGDPCRGRTIGIRRGIYDEQDPEGRLFIYSANANGTYSYTDANGEAQKERYHEEDGVWDAPEIGPTGFFLKKFADETVTPALGNNDSWVPWPVFRLAEVYLNKAEAAYELGDMQEATNAINEVRRRAGIKELSTAELTMERIRNERRVELAYENHRFWDVRRWRIAANPEVLGYFTPMGLYPWYDVRSQAYVFTSEKVPRPVRIFETRNYYVKISEDDMGANPNLAPNNPGY